LADFKKDILDGLADIETKVRELKEMLLANLVMVGEIPAPTFKEEERIDFLINRFREEELDHVSVDEVGNGIGMLKGESGEGNILLVAHADTEFSEKTDHTLVVHQDKVTGPGVADNSLGFAVLATLPIILDKLDIKLQNNLLLLGDVRSLGRGNLEGLRFFLENTQHPVKAGIGVEGVKLGRLSHKAIGMLRGEISCEVPEEYDWSKFGDASAILTLNEVINKINEIRLPTRPRTSIVMGAVEGGTSFNTTALNSKLGFEIRSESSEQVRDIHQSIKEIVTEISSTSGDTINLDIFAGREPGGIPFAHPMIRHTRQIMETLDINPRPGPSTSELSAFIDFEVPAITLGLTHGDQIHERNESVVIDPIFKGIAQLIGTLLAIDGGYCEED